MKSNEIDSLVKAVSGITTRPVVLCVMQPNGETTITPIGIENLSDAQKNLLGTGIYDQLTNHRN